MARPRACASRRVQGAAQVVQTGVLLESINSQLSARVMRSYGAFVHGMEQVQQLEGDLVLASMLCRTSRRSLGRAHGDLVEGARENLGSD